MHSELGLGERESSRCMFQNIILEAQCKGKVPGAVYHVIKTYGGVEIELHALLTSALDGGEWSAPHPHHYTRRESPGTHWAWGWVRPKTGLDMATGDTSVCPCKYPVTILTELRTE
jgi:hypothetical protein